MSAQPAVATAIASAAKPDPGLAADVVREALARAGIGIARSLLLFLSSEFVHCAHAAVVAASRAANCLHVTGCTAAGILTEEDWVLDRPAACAMIFGAGLGLGAQAAAEAPLLTLAVPAAAPGNWLAAGGPRYGLLSTDNSAHHPGRIWCHGKMAADGRCEAALVGTRTALGVSQGVRVLGEPQPAVVDGYDVRTIGPHPALDTLLRGLPLELRGLEKPPFHSLALGVVSGDPSEAVAEGRYTLVPVIGANYEDRSVGLAAPVEAGARVFWTLRQALAAERDMRQAADRAAAQLGAAPDFGLLFSCLGRGPYFYGGQDRDLAVLRERFPGLPLIGAYGGGQIAPLCGDNRILHNAAVLGLFKAHV